MKINTRHGLRKALAAAPYVHRNLEEELLELLAVLKVGLKRPLSVLSLLESLYFPSMPSVKACWLIELSTIVYIKTDIFLLFYHRYNLLNFLMQHDIAYRCVLYA